MNFERVKKKLEPPEGPAFDPESTIFFPSFNALDTFIKERNSSIEVMHSLEPVHHKAEKDNDVIVKVTEGGVITPVAISTCKECGFLWKWEYV